MITSEKELMNKISTYSHYDAIIVEGYDGVGKGRVLRLLSEKFDVLPYRPDYNLWQTHDHRVTDRWKVSGFFLDVYSHFNIKNDKPMLFDRGVLSGAVYNSDMSIAADYKSFLRDMRVVHILITCNLDDFKRFHSSRNVDTNIEEEWSKYKKYTTRYLNSFSISGVEYLIYSNRYDQSTPQNTCEGCGHYNYGWCRHPSMNCLVDSKNERCAYSQDKEVQDNVTEMHCL